MLPPLAPDILVEGHAIISEDGMIADHDGTMPAKLQNDADWQQFQSALDRAALVVLGREGHIRHPNPGRRRLVLTRKVTGLTVDAKDALSTFWNPSHLSFANVLDQMNIRAGTIAITGGTGVFDCFLSIGYTSFALAQVSGFRIPNGRPAFSGGQPRAMLSAHGLVAGVTELIDEKASVTLTRWQRVAKSPFPNPL